MVLGALGVSIDGHAEGMRVRTGRSETSVKENLIDKFVFSLCCCLILP